MHINKLALSHLKPVCFMISRLPVAGIQVACPAKKSGVVKQCIDTSINTMTAIECQRLDLTQTLTIQGLRTNACRCAALRTSGPVGARVRRMPKPCNAPICRAIPAFLLFAIALLHANAVLADSATLTVGSKRFTES